MDTKNLTLGELIMTVRRRAKLTQTKLAQQVGVHISTISRWERNVATEEMPLKCFVKIAKATNTPVSDFLSLQEGS